MYIYNSYQVYFAKYGLEYIIFWYPILQKGKFIIKFVIVEYYAAVYFKFVLLILL